MRAALIPPKGYEAWALESTIHLVLPLAPLLKSTSYLHTYATARKRGDYIILDNGCAEGELVDGATLINFARYIRANEIVAPDVMSDAGETLEATVSFLRDYPEASDYNIMAVLQGSTPEDREFLLEQFVKHDAITAIGIPKVHVTEEGSEVRKDIARMIHKVSKDRFQIHLLGLSKAYPTEMRDVNFRAGSIRSMDSAQPFKVTELNHLLVSDPDATRRPTYFTHKKEVNAATLRMNINTFKEWAETSEG